MTLTINALDALENDMPTVAWFAALPEDRKAAAIQGSYLWKLTGDQERLWGKLGPHADHSEGLNVNRDYEGLDPTVTELLDRVPDMLMDGFILMASSVLMDSLEVMAQVCRRYAPEILVEVAKEYEQIEPYMRDGKRKGRLAGRDRATAPLQYEGDRAKLWDALKEVRANDPKAAAEIDRAWRMNARAEYLVRETLKATAGDC
jgi:hypothetical protein